MRYLAWINLDILLKDERQLSVDVGPDLVVHTDPAGRLTALTHSDPRTEGAFNRLKFLDVSQVIAITATEYWLDDYADDAEAEFEPEQQPMAPEVEPEPEQGDDLQSAARLEQVDDNEEDEYGRLPMTVEVLAAVAEVRRIMGQTNAE